MKNYYLLIAVLSLAGCEALTGTRYDHTLTGSYSMPMVINSSSNGGVCALNYTVTGNIEFGYNESGSGIQGEVKFRDHKRTFISGATCTDSSSGANFETMFSGPSSNISFTTTFFDGLDFKVEFAGALSGGAVNATLKMSASGTTNGSTRTGSASTNVTLK